MICTEWLAEQRRILEQHGLIKGKRMSRFQKWLKSWTEDDCLLAYLTGCALGALIFYGIGFVTGLIAANKLGM